MILSQEKENPVGSFSFPFFDRLNLRYEKDLAGPCEPKKSVEIHLADWTVETYTHYAPLERGN